MASNDEIVGYFQRHLVPVYFSCRNENDTQNFIVTAFVLSVGNQWFLVTAGHCIHTIESLIHEFGYQITRCSLLDSVGLAAIYRDPIPFDYASAQPVCLSEEREFDYGVMQLSPYYRRLLEANGVQALNEEV